jgi:hypothetical protein
MMPDWLWITLMILGVLLIVSALCAVGISLDYYTACRKAEMFNHLHGTGWTCSDFFWAGDQINAGSITINK